MSCNGPLYPYPGKRTDGEKKCALCDTTRSLMFIGAPPFTRPHPITGWWTCSKCKSDVKAWQADWEDSNHEPETIITEFKVGSNTLQVLTKGNQVEIRTNDSKDSNDCVTKMSLKDYQFCMEPKRLQYPPGSSHILQCDFCGCVEPRLTSSNSNNYDDSIGFHAIDFMLIGHLGWMTCDDCEHKVPSLRKKCFLSREEIATMLGWSVDELKNFPMKRSNGTMETGWSIQGAYRNPHGWMRILAEKGDHAKTLQFKHLMLLKATLMDPSYTIVEWQ
jgi:hypothetical protein